MKTQLPDIFSRDRARRIGLVAGLALVQAVAAGTAAFATRDIFAALHASDGALPWVSVLAIALSGLAIAAARVAERSVAEGIGQDYATAVRVRLFDHIARLSAADMARLRAGALNMRFVGDLAAFRNWVSRGIARLVSASIVLPASAVVLFLLNPPLALAAALPIGAGLCLMAVIGVPLGRAHRRLRSKHARLAADIGERIPHAPELRLLGRQRIEREHLLRRSRKLAKAATHRTRLAEGLRAIPDVTAGLAAAGVFLAGWRWDLVAADIAAGLAVVGLTVQPMRDFAGVWDRRRAWCAARDKCDALLSRRQLPAGSRTAVSGALDRPCALTFRGLRLSENATFDAIAQPGEKIAIMGPNGSGKSTLLHLAAGLEHCREGQVLLGDLPVGRLRGAARRQALLFVGTKPPILAGSVRRALTMGLPKLPDDPEILSAVESLGLSPLLERLGGLDGTVAEGAGNLSRGECQRVLLVRVALARARIALLDEPEAGLDGEGEVLAADVIRRSPSTILFVTHSRYLASYADRIWQFDCQGEIQEITPGTVSGGDTASRTDDKLRRGRQNAKAIESVTQ